jgi:hypothetical protein
MVMENNQAQQLRLLSPADLAGLEVEAGHSPSWTRGEAETASRAGRNVGKPPPPEAGLMQEQLPGLTWPIPLPGDTVAGGPELDKKRSEKELT